VYDYSKSKMEYTVTLTLPPTIYREAVKRAIATNSTIEQVLAEQLQETWQPFPSIHVSSNRAAMAREDAAYRLLHPELVKQLLGQYVAIFQGQVVDHDQDEDAILQRRRDNYPGKVVLIRRVEFEVERELAFRSPRFATTSEPP
jgi:hypothetical protein